MKPILITAAACAALLAALPAEAKLFHQRQVRHSAEVQVVATVAPQAIVQPQTVTYRQGTRRLRLGERIRARIAAGKAIRELRVPTVEPIVSPESSETLRVESSVAGE